MAGRRRTEVLLSDGRKAVLRPMTWEDLDACVTFATGLAEEHAADLYHGTLLSNAPTKAEETEWLAKMLVSIENGTVINVAAEVDGFLAGNSEVRRSSVPDLSLHGVLGIAVAKPYRGLGLGSAMLSELLRLSRDAGLRTVELAALATNERAIRLYERVGFRRVGTIPKKINRRGTAIDEMVMSIEL